MSQNKEKTELRKTANSVLGTAIVLLVFAVLCFFGYFSSIRKLNAIEGGVIAEAEIVNTSYFNPHTKVGRGYWRLEYEYIDENGVRYSGYDGSSFNNEAEAMQYLGTKVDIYIDGKGHSIVVGNTPANTELMIIAIVLIVLAIVAIAVYCKLLVIDKRRIEVREKIRVSSEKLKCSTNSDNLSKIQINTEPIFEIQKEEITTDTAIEDVSNIEE